MNNYTSAKYEYDKLAKEFFISCGYDRVEILGTGRLPDLAAWNNTKTKLAIIEVKSPSETDAWKDQPYKKRDFNLNGIERKHYNNVVKGLPLQGYGSKPFLVAVTISNQLYCYYWDAIDSSELYGYIIPNGVFLSEANVEAFLVVPLEWKPIVQVLSNYFHSEGLLPQPLEFAQRAAQKTDRLCVARVLYPSSRPVDLAAARRVYHQPNEIKKNFVSNIVTSNYDSVDTVRISRNPSFQRVLDRYSDVAPGGYELQGTAKNYQYINPPGWPAKIHYEFSDHGSHGISIEIHLDKRTRNPWPIRLINDVHQLKQEIEKLFPNASVEWNPWSFGERMIIYISSASISSNEVANMMVEFIDKTKSKIDGILKKHISV